MNRILACTAAATAILVLLPPTAEARVHRGGFTTPHQRHARRPLHASHVRRPLHASHVPSTHVPASPVHATRGAPENSYGNAPGDRSYEGPGATVFGRTVQFQQAPGVTTELDPAARESATGGPSGGLPNNGSGP